MNTSFFGELLQTISDQGKALVERTRGRRGAPADRSESLVDLCEELVSKGTFKKLDPIKVITRDEWNKKPGGRAAATMVDLD